MNNNMSRDFCKEQFLFDFKLSGGGNVKIVNWDDYKNMSLNLANSFKRSGINKYHRVLYCGSDLIFKRYGDELKLFQANFCKVRLCPMCSWRRSLKIFGQVSKIMNVLSSDSDYNFLFLTLTCRNVAPECLSEQLNVLFKSFRSLIGKKAFKTAVKGWFRCLEVTHNWKDGSFHPHFHIILVVNKSYFTDTRLYLSHDDWVLLWKACMNVDYLPVVDIRRFKASKRGIGKEVAEVAKYAVKPSDLFLLDKQGNIVEDKTDNAISVLDVALANRRLIAFGGVFKELHKKLRLDDIEQGSLIANDIDDMRDDLSYILEHYKWHVGYSRYVLTDDD